MNIDDIIDIFKRVLNAQEVDANSDFFELGGDSLLATRVLSAIARQFELELMYDDFVDDPTPHGLFAKVVATAS